MSKEIKSVSLTASTVGAITAFYQSVSTHISEATAEALHVKTQADELEKLVDDLIEVQNKQRALVSTISTQEADAVRDKIIRYLYSQVRAQMKSPVAKTSSAAKRIDLVLRSYPNLPELELERQTTQVDGLVRDLSATACTPDVTTLSLAETIEQLADANADYVIASQNRAAETQAAAAIADGKNSNILRQQAAEVYRDIAKRVNAYSLTAETADPKMDKFIDQVNGEILILEKVMATEAAANTRHRKKKNTAIDADTETETPINNE